MVAQVLGEVPGWVNDWGVIVGFLVACCTLGVFVVRFTHKVVTLLGDAVEEKFNEKLEPVNIKLDHLHDCVERVGGEAAANAKEAVTAVKDHASKMQEHINADAVAFEEAQHWRLTTLKEWQDSVDVSLSNIQNAQAPHDPSARDY